MEWKVTVGRKPGTPTKTGGRNKGTPNRATARMAAEIAASGLTPLDYMLAVMRDPRASAKRRDEMAKAAAPYVHPRLAALTNSQGDGPAEITVTVIDADRIKALSALIARHKMRGDGNPDSALVSTH
jgi:hypothetical protein